MYISRCNQRLILWLRRPIIHWLTSTDTQFCCPLHASALYSCNKTLKCPICLIICHLLHIEVIGFISQIVGQQEYLASPFDFAITKIGLTFSDKMMIQLGICTAIVFFRSNGLNNQVGSPGGAGRRSPTSLIAPMSITPSFPRSLIS